VQPDARRFSSHGCLVWGDGSLDPNPVLVDRIDLPQGEDGGEPAHVITFLPQDAGVLQPLAQQRLEASICPLTDAPLRTNLMAVVEHGRTSFVTARADVVVPKACLSVTEFDLGVTYVDVKIRRTMTLQNLTKMPAAFSFDLALLNAWSPAAMSVDVVPDKGELEPSESIELMVEFWPRQVCRATASHPTRRFPPYPNLG
jgi:hypothetical protein